MLLQLNLYGLIIGVALVVGFSLIEKQIEKEPLLQKFFSKVALLSFLFAVLGARLWHIITDYHLYEENLMGTLQIWNGGLSIIGGVIGGVFGLVFSFFLFQELRKIELQKKKQEILKLLDYTIFGLPVGQAIGRWGNYFNQELYGSPTNGFFKIYIDSEHRLPSYQQFSYYHPLFFYEMIGTGIFASMVYLLLKKSRLPKIGTGKLFTSYVFYYSLLRFFLDFLRLDKQVVLFGLLGFNQLFLLGIALVCFLYLFHKYFHIWFERIISYNTKT